jgi:hypothetical protein
MRLGSELPNFYYESRDGVLPLLVQVRLKHVLILINARRAAFLFYFPKLPES